VSGMEYWVRAGRGWLGGGAGRLRRLPGEVLLWRDAAAFLRLCFLAVAADLGLLGALEARPVSATDLAADLDVVDADLFEAFLALGVQVGELRCARGQWRLRGRRARALAAAPAEALRGMLAEARQYDVRVYGHLVDHLRGAPPGGYLDGLGAVIACASRVVEPFLAPYVASVVGQRHPRRLLDVGCGSGVYLIHAAAAADQLTAVGVERDLDAARVARRRLAEARLADRIEVVAADVRVADPGGPFQLVLLLQNIYYFDEPQRPALFARLRSLLAPGGALVLASLCSGPSVTAAHYDLLFRVTAGCTPLPRIDVLDRQLHDAGFSTTHWRRLIPGQPFHAVIAERPVP
jgi:4-hydroxy-2,2'-bipyrrole-5-carbaldehyde O-methyltransferase